MRVLVVRHHEEDDPAFVADAFAAAGADISTLWYRHGAALPELGPGDHAVVLGANASVYDRRHTDWIDPELAWLRSVATAGAGVLGICFGAQLLSAAFGGSVERSPAIEIGWTTIEAAPPSDTRPELPISSEAVVPGPWLEFHGDRCVLPSTAVVVARNETCVQAFTIGRNFGVQFHPEVDATQLARWLDHGSTAAVEAAGLDPDKLLRQTKAQEPSARRRARTLVDAYLEAFAATR